MCLDNFCHILGALRCCNEISHEYPLEGYDPSVIIGEKFVEKPRNKKIEKPKKVQPPPVVDHLEITIAELQQFLENAKKLSELEQRTSNSTPNQTNDDSIILAVESQGLQNESVKAPTNVKNGEDVLPEILKERLQKMKEHVKKVSEMQDDSTENSNIEVSDKKTDNTVINENSDVSPVEVVKLSSARDSDETSVTQGKLSNDSPEIDTQGTRANEFNTSDNYTIIYKSNLSNGVNSNIMDEKTKSMMNKLINATGVDESLTNNSVFQEFVQTIIKVTGRSNTFDPQSFLEHIRVNGVYRNESWSREYQLLRCKAQPFLQRLSVLGQFFY